MDTNNPTLNAQLQERFKELPKIVQDAITSAEVESHLRKLADTNKLHLDQWQQLENEVMLTLLGFEQPENLAQNIQSEIGLTMDAAQSLASAISSGIFEPIRQQLERNLEHPDAHMASVSDTEAARTQAIDEAHAEAAAAAPTVAPATPPAPAPDVKIARPTEASAYKPGEPSHARTAVHDDPYREPPA